MNDCSEMMQIGLSEATVCSAEDCSIGFNVQFQDYEMAVASNIWIRSVKYERHLVECVDMLAWA